MTDLNTKITVDLADVNRARRSVLELPPASEGPEGQRAYQDAEQIISAVVELAEQLRALARSLDNESNYLRTALELRRQGAVMPIHRVYIPPPRWWGLGDTKSEHRPD